ncbi:MAG: metal-dependent hydrolase [Methanobrevibacter sp.]|jgi:L-ascorbate metabolism protein UlaG (beta-lactamase superfamily)|nr:metal-dependent hydrolase [Methanobrevibacter sp.]
MQIKWIGHSAFEIITDSNVKIIIDPFISNNPSTNIPVEELNPDYILITHGHSDHLGDAMEIANRSGAKCIGNHELSLFLSKQGLDSIGMNIGGSILIKDVKITMLEAKHSADIDFTEEITSGGVAVSYLIETETGTKILHCGDTGLFSDMEKVIGAIYKPDIVLVPIGDRFTMGPFEAALAVNWMSPKIAIPMHYNTFPPIEQNPIIFSNFVKQLNPKIDVIILNPGEIYEREFLK